MRLDHRGEILHTGTVKLIAYLATERTRLGKAQMMASMFAHTQGNG